MGWGGAGKAAAKGASAAGPPGGRGATAEREPEGRRGDTTTPPNTTPHTQLAAGVAEVSLLG